MSINPIFKSLLTTGAVTSKRLVLSLPFIRATNSDNKTKTDPDHDTRPVTLFIDFDNIMAGKTPLSKSIADRFDALIEHIMEQHFNNAPFQVRIYGNFEFNPLDNPWLPEYCTLIDTPVVTTSGKTETDPMIMVDMLLASQTQQVGLMSNDVDFAYVLNHLEQQGNKPVLLTNFIHNKKLPQAVSRHIDARTTMLDIGVCPLSMYERELMLLTQNGEGSFHRFSEKAMPAYHVDYSEHGFIHFAGKAQCQHASFDSYKKEFGVPDLSPEQYRALFSSLSNSHSIKNLDEIVTSVRLQLAAKGWQTDESDLRHVVMKLLPWIGKRSGPQLARKYVKWLESHIKSHAGKFVMTSKAKEGLLMRLAA
ncbi:NYN domain-containing protein [Vibrio parahaemolyticus]|uniref:NYN domain-containing protein n=1 Tax=Vibrio parahaemolyticus TaxID=670 RepID=UPI0004DF17AA|nr:NYN domain-containing protein [Vibrio parahaemolyticus]